MGNDLIAYEEEKQLAKKINAIIFQKDFAINKMKKLESLRGTVISPLSQSQIDYYIHRLKSEALLRVGRIISFVVVMIYLFFTLFRVYWFYHPERNPFTSGGKSLTVIDLVTGFYYVAAAALGIYVIYRIMRRFLQKRRKSENSLN